MNDSVSHRVILRPAIIGDCRRLWEWRNEEATREASFHMESIPFEAHEAWFSRKLNDPYTRIFIATDVGGRELGYARFDISQGEAEISVSLDKGERGKGYGIEVIRQGSDQVLKVEAVQRIIAHVKTSNPASRVAFERAGFLVRGCKEIAGTEAYEMVYEGRGSGS